MTNSSLRRFPGIGHKFRKVFLHPTMIGHIILLGGWIVVLTFLSVLHLEILFFYGVVAWIAGWVIWTLAEYFLNRYLLHLPGSNIPILNAIIQFHSQHHEDPGNITYIFVHPLLVGFAVAHVMVLSLMTVGNAGLLITSGFLFGYLWFSIIHALQHHYTPPAQFLINLWQHHYLHHRSSQHAAYGVSTQVWDVIFNSPARRRTFITVDPAKLKVANPAQRVLEVKDFRSKKMFMDLPKSIYAEDPTWITSLKSEADSFNPVVNSFFTHGAAKRWLLIDESGEVLGRIAAFVDFNKMLEDDNWVGTIGFFECSSGQSGAFALFDTAVLWLEKYFKITAVEGPVNFADRDKYSGLLTQDFTTPSFEMNYHQPVYRKYFEDYGFMGHPTQSTRVLDLQMKRPDTLRAESTRTKAT